MGYGLWVNLIQPAEPHRGLAQPLPRDVRLKASKQRFETRNITFQFQGLEPRRFQAMGQLNTTCVQPRREQRRVQGVRGVALQVAYERRTLKPVFSLDRL
jgi:hypothetical protein